MIDWQTTGVGSVPFQDSSEAIEYIFSSYSIPFYPQLVKNDRYVASPLPQGLQEVVPAPILKLFLEKSACLNDDAQLDVRWKQEVVPHLETLPGIKEFARRLHEFEDKFYKVQFLGPATATHLLETLYGQQLSPGIRFTIEENIFILVTKVLKAFRNAHLQPIVIWDDPMGPTPSVLDKFSFLESLIGLHCCGIFSIADVAPRLRKRYLSFDLSQIKPSTSEYEAINFLSRHGGVILGIVDTRLKEINEKDSENNFKALVENVSFDVKGSNFMPSILSGGCGTGMHSIAFEKKLSKLLNEIRHRS
jgi:hypothetical protein